MASAATVDMIRDLREKTGAGVMDCKRALEGANGDLAKAGGDSKGARTGERCKEG